MLLEVNNITFGYGDKNVLSNINFSINEGEILSLLGPNGTGKTTLIKCINNILKPRSGSVTINEQNILDMKQKDIAKIIAYVPQYSTINFPINTIDLIMMGRTPFLKNSSKEEDKNIVFEIMERMDLERYAFKDINTMSGGERQRVLIARALAQQPKVLILDEPTNNLDMKNQLLILRFIKKLVIEKKIAVIMSIHDLNLASMFSDKILMLKDSKVFSYGSCKNVINKENIKELYNVEVSISLEDDCKYIRLLNKEPV